MHRNYMRRGVSLEVIVEEDDNAEVSLDPMPFHDSTDTSSSPTLSGESDVDNKSSTSSSSSSSSSSSTTTMELENEDRESNHYRFNQTATDRLRQEKEKRRKQKKEERWRFLERQRSLSCETLTILDVGDDEFSREQWEVETRDWDAENPNKGTEIIHCISRKKILATRFTEQEPQYDGEFESPPPKRKIGENGGDDEDAAGSERETHVDDDDADGDDENETDNDEAGVENDRYWWNPEKVCPQDTGNLNANVSEYKEENQNQIIMHTNNTALLNEDQEQDSLEDEPIGIETFSASCSEEDEKEKKDEQLNCDIEISQNYRKFEEVNNNSTHNFTSAPNNNIHNGPFSGGEDSWITVGELIDGTEEEKDTDNEENHTDDLKKESPQNVRKEVRFSDKLEFLTETKTQTSSTTLDVKPIPHIPNDSENIKHKVKSSEITIDESINKESEVLIDNLVSVKAGKSLFEKPQTNRCVPPLVERLTAVLETPDIMIIERNVDPQVLENENSTEVVLNDEHSTVQMTKTHNAVIRPEELPPPRTVASVRKLFEQLPTLTVCNISQYKQSSRFDHVRSNPTSKILRFDRHDSNHSTKSLERIKPLSSKLTKNINSTKPSSSPSTITIPQIPKEIPNPFPICEEIIEETRRRSQKNWLPPKPPSDDISATGVPLRKPQVANGFNVQKALRENPRYFHIRVDEKGRLIKGEEVKKPTSSVHQSQQKSNNEKGKRNSSTYSYLEAKHQRHTGNTTSLRWIKESVDRSDSESMSSESSEDSGVSRDFTSTIISSFTTSSKKKIFKRKDPNIIQQQYGSDPSYKWIDPTVLAKIRARGTTVIYFGPRHRPQGGQGNRNRCMRKSPDYKLPTFEEEDLQSNEEISTEISKDISFVDKRTKGKNDSKNHQEKDIGSGTILPVNDVLSQTIASTNTNINQKSTVKIEATSRPKIIGVKHKRAPEGSIETISTDSTHNNKDDNGQKQFQPKPFLHTDSRIIHMRELKKKSTAANSVIYDFTEKDA